MTSGTAGQAPELRGRDDSSQPRTGALSTAIALRDMTTGEAVEIAQTAEAAGLTHLFIPESGPKDRWPIEGRDPFLVAHEVLSHTSRLVVGTGIAGTIFRPPRIMAVAAATLNEQYPDRFILGCGVSRPDLAQVVGVPFPKSPVSHAAAYCEELCALSRAGLQFGGGFRVYLAARGDKMLAVAARSCDGAILTLVSPQECTRIVDLMVREGGDRPMLPTTVALIRVGSNDVLSRDVSQYLAGVSGYAEQFERQGLRTAAEIVQSTGITDLGRSSVEGRLHEYRAAGIGIPCLFPRELSVRETCELLNDLAS